MIESGGGFARAVGSGNGRARFGVILLLLILLALLWIGSNGAHLPGGGSLLCDVSVDKLLSLLDVL
jgi:hypothetical protein